MSRFGNVYTAAIGLSGDYARRKREIENDPNLSVIGRKAAIEKLDATSMLAADKLYSTFRKDYEKHAETINSKLKKANADPVEKMRELMKADMVRDVNLSSYSTVTDPIISDNARTMLLLQALDGLSSKITSAPQVQVLAHRSADWNRKERDKAVEARDIPRLELLLQAAQLRDNETEAVQLERVLTSDLERLRAENLSPEELEVVSQQQALDKEAALLDASFESFRDPERRQFIDYRQAEAEPATTLSWTGSRGLPAAQGSNGGEGGAGEG